MDDSVKYYTPSANEDEDGHLTWHGRQEIARWWREHYVYDEDGSVSTDDLRDGLPWTLYVRGEDLHDALVSEAGAELRPGSEDFFAARPNDGLGAECERFVDQAIYAPAYLVDGLVLHSSVSLIVGESNSLKSWLAASLLVALAHGRTWLGRASRHGAHDRRKLVYVDYEMGREELVRRLKILGDDGTVKRVPHPVYRLNDDAFWSGLAKLDPAVVVLDSLSSGYPDADEKDARFANPLRRAAAFAQAQDCTIIGIHHPPKDTSGGNFVRGTGATFAAVDACYYVEREGPDVAKVTFAKWRRGRTPPPFRFTLRDDVGVIAHDGAPTTALRSDADDVAEEIARHPDGASASALAATLHRRKADVLSQLRALEADGRVRTAGRGPATRWHLAP